MHKLAARVRESRARALVHAWEYRQRKYAKGVWFRLRRVLTRAAEAYVISTAEAERLLSEGWLPEAVSQELEPPRMILFVSKERASAIAERRSIAVTLSPDLLGASALVLVKFER